MSQPLLRHHRWSTALHLHPHGWREYGIGQAKLEAMMERVDMAHLLICFESGKASATFGIFLADTTLEIEGTTVIIRTANTFAHSWIENRMSDKLLKRLRIELSQELTELHCVG